MIWTYSRQSSREANLKSRNDTGLLLGIAGTMALIHMFTNHLYGFHRDELQFLSDAKHLDWGFVAYPPLTPLVERISLEVFGLSLTGLRLASVLAQSLAIVLTGPMTRKLGGGRLSLVAAALAVALPPIALFEGTEFQYTSFDYLWWALAFDAEYFGAAPWTSSLRVARVDGMAPLMAVARSTAVRVVLLLAFCCVPAWMDQLAPPHPDGPSCSAVWFGWTAGIVRGHGAGGRHHSHPRGTD